MRLINIVQAENKHISQCKNVLQSSSLGKIYFRDEDKINRALNSAIENNELFIGMDHNENFIGFVWFTLNGAFSMYPCLHMIIIKEEFRNCGFGKILLKYFEEASTQTSNKVFLMVGDFNQRAKELYKRIGYREIGFIPDFYKGGVCETLMMKII